MAWLPTARLVTFGRIPHHVFRVHLLKNLAVATVSLSTFIVMCISANLIALTEPLFYYKFAAFALATSLLTLITVIPMYAFVPGQVRSLMA